MADRLLGLAKKALGPFARARAQLRARRQRRVVRGQLGSSRVLGPLESGGELPRGYGRAANERVVEIPWLLAQKPHGRMLDAGSALNNAGYLDALLPLLSELHIVTLAYEGTAHPERGISYSYADLRALPYLDGYFDTVASISTLEHVGMDNSGYGSRSPRAEDPAQEAELAVRELVRVLGPGGRLLLTVPYGRREDHGSFRQLDREDLERLIAAAAPAEKTISVYRYSEQGWGLSDLDRAADARYRTDFAAEAVVCVRMIV